MTESVEIAVIGGGIVGTTAAFYLARAGARVALIERNDLAQGTTDNSFAWINATSKSADRDYHHLNALGRQSYLALAREFGEQALGINPCGAVRIVERSDETNYPVVREQLAQLQDWGYPVTWLENQAVSAMEPHLALPADAEALYSPGDMSLNAPQFTRFMAQQITAMDGLVLQQCQAREIVMQDDGTVTGVMTDQGVINCRKILLTVGRDMGDVLSDLTGFQGFANRFPLNQVPGLLLTTASTGAHRLINRVVYFASGPDLHALPDFSGGIKVGADDTDGMITADAGPEEMQKPAEILLDRLKQRLPHLADHIGDGEANLRIGVRPYPQDGVSIAGALPGAEGLYVATTHSGVTLAPAIGNLMCDVILKGRTPEALAPFSLQRFPGFNG